jgi:uncharacterized protein (DUF1684 family)
MGSVKTMAHMDNEEAPEMKNPEMKNPEMKNPEMKNPEMKNNDILDLADWRRRVSDLYGRVRRAAEPRLGWEQWRDTRDAMFGSHPQSPIAPNDRSTYAGVPLFDHDPAVRFLVDVETIEDAVEETWDIAADGALRLFPGLRTRGLQEAFGGELTIYQIKGYGGGLFLPFKDATCGAETYGGGRYLLDTIKGADLGMEAGKLVLDFNLAYHPSCRHSDAWVCPLAPTGNTLPVAVRAGERMSVPV